jgi:hypothetical protein
MIMTAKRVDINQAMIVEGLRAIGCTVQDLSQLGKGCPDLLVGYHFRNYLIEVKNSENRSATLTPCEERWIKRWAGEIAVVTNLRDAIAIVVEDGD